MESQLVGILREGGKTPQIGMEEDRESLHATIFSSIFDLCNLKGKPTHRVRKLIVFFCEA
jgi:hypothetical protein